MNIYRYIISSVFLVVGGLAIALNLNSEPKPAPRTYIGQESCMAANCHEQPNPGTSDFKGAAAFRETMHQKIHLRPSPETVVIDKWFDRDTVLRYVDLKIRLVGRDTLLVHLFKSPDKKDYMIQMSFSDGGDSLPPFKVAYTYGGRGWIERLLLDVNGRFYVAPFQYKLPRYIDRTDSGGAVYFLDLNRWYDIDSNFEAKFYKIASNKFRTQAWQQNCTPCHVNGFQMTRDVNGTDTMYTSKWFGVDSGDSALIDQNIKIGCESCHGPGSEHAANPTVDNIVSPGRREQFPRTMVGTDLKLDLCAQCHSRFLSTKKRFKFALNDSTLETFVPGVPLADFQFDLRTGFTAWGDNLTSYAHHQQVQDYQRSVPYQKHVFTDGCWSCHTVHYNKYDSSFGGTLPFQLDRNWYTMKSGEGCLAAGCHADKDSNVFSPIVNRTVNKHTMHSPGVSQCVNCHFTKTATIGFIDLPTHRGFEFTDHSFKVLRPSLTRDAFFGSSPLGMINTCAEACHRNGRGSRNSFDSTPAAPNWGITDRQYGFYKETTDLWLADSLWKYYQLLYPQYVVSVRESEVAGAATKITSVSPNPFTVITSVRFTVARAARVDLEVYTLKGERVKVLAAGMHQPGSYVESWDGTDELATSLPVGVYMIRLKTDRGVVSAQKVVLAR